MASHLVVLHTTTAGISGNLLGSDEEEIVALVWLVVDLASNKVVAVQQNIIKPRIADVNENILSDHCRTEYGLSEDQVKNAAQSLEHVIDQFDQMVAQKLPNFQLVTDGQLHLRQVLHPEACNKAIELSEHFYSFFDLRKVFRQFYNTEQVSECIADMLNHLSVEADVSAELCLRPAHDMAKIILRMVSDGYKFDDPEPISSRLEHGICSKNEEVDNHSVVRARGLPWQSSDQDIAKFFRGLNIARGGVALCLSPQGRRNGEALVRFINQEQRDMALKRHKHHISNRYIEVYKASGEDFINVAGGNSNEAQNFLSKGGQVIVRMRGLPYDCIAKQVVSFFESGDSPCRVMDEENGVLFVKKPDGRATGDAFVLFDSEDEAQKALSKHRLTIGARYIELFRSTTAEVQQVLNRSMDPRTYEPQQPLIAPLPPVPLIPQHVITSGTRKDCIRLRGLPYEAQVEQILEFLGEHAKSIMFQGVHMVFNAQGQPSGECFIQMDSEQSAMSAAQQRHHKFMFHGKKQRYIEVFQCSGEDMNLVLTGGIPQRAMISPGAALPLSPYPYAQAPPLMPAVSPLTPRPQAYYSPVFYWPYPSPPVSPTSYYTHSAPTLLSPDCIQLQRNGDGRPSGDALVTFQSRAEAERAIHEKNRQNIGNRYIELFMTPMPMS